MLNGKMQGRHCSSGKLSIGDLRQNICFKRSRENPSTTGRLESVVVNKEKREGKRRKKEYPTAVIWTHMIVSNDGRRLATARLHIFTAVIDGADSLLSLLLNLMSH